MTPPYTAKNPLINNIPPIYRGSLGSFALLAIFERSASVLDEGSRTLSLLTLYEQSPNPYSLIPNPYSLIPNPYSLIPIP